MLTLNNNRKLIFVGGKGGTGKCSKYNTLILTDKGLIKIEDIVHKKIDFSNDYIDHEQTNLYDLYNDKEKDSEIVNDDDNIKTINNLISISPKLKYEKYKIVDRYDMGDNDVITIKTRIGLELSGTPEHRIIIIDNNGKLRFKKLEDISKSDHIAISHNTNIFNDKLKLNFFHRKNKYSSNASQILKNIDYMNNDIARLLGYIISEANADFDDSGDVRSFLITTYDKEMQDDIINICNKIGIDTSYHYVENKNNENPIGIKINSVAFGNLIYYLGYRHLSQNQEVPWSILQADKESQISFLRALFDGDGTVGLGDNNDGPVVEYNSSSYELCRQLQIMLLNFGIIGRLHSKKGAISEYKDEIREYDESKSCSSAKADNSYRLYLHGGEILKFAEIINFGLPRKKEILNKCIDILENRKRWTDITFPNIGEILNKLYDELKLLGQQRKIIKEWQEDFVINDKIVKLNRRKSVSCKTYLKNNQQLLYWYIKEGKPSIYELKKIFSIMEPVSYLQEYKYLETLSEQFIFDNVVDIRNEKTRVYDVTIDDVHSYIGNAIFNHNTTTASTISLHLSELINPGEKILLFSTDPAHSLSDSFNVKIREFPTQITNTLDAVEINTDQLMSEFKREHGNSIQKMLLRGTRLNRQETENAIGLTIPGVDEFMSLMKLSSYIGYNNYRTIVVDTAPTGHTLRLLTMPNVVNGWAMFFSGLHNRYKNIMWRITGADVHDNVDDFITILSQSIYNVYSMITDSNQTEFVIVTIPDLMALEETRRLYISLYSMGILVNNMVINNIQANTDCAFCRARRNHQNRYINDIERLYPGINKIYIPLFSEDINGMAHLREFENYLFN